MSVLSKEEMELKLALIKHEAEHKSAYETEQMVALTRFCHHMACQNTENQLKPSLDGGIVIPPNMIAQMAVGFAKNANNNLIFCVFFQVYLWEMIKSIPLEGMIVDVDSQAIVIKFKEVVIGEFKIPALSLSLPINSHAIWHKLTQEEIRLCTVAGIHRSEDNFDHFYCYETQADPAPFLRQYYITKQRHALF